jgi:cytochrome c biogenesis protein CcmG/thiol:disulfide interchange protein DsbE
MSGPDGAGAAPPRPRIVFLLIGLVVAVGLGVGLFTSIGTPKAAVPAAGSPAPSFSLASLTGGGPVGTPASGGGNGRPAVLVFFASWCGPCHAEMPALARAYRDQTPSGRVAVIGVDGMDPVHSALAFVRASGVSFPVAKDPDYRVTEGLYGFDGDPDAVFVKADGTIARIVHGPITAPQLLTWERDLR